VKEIERGDGEIVGAGEKRDGLRGALVKRNLSRSRPRSCPRKLFEKISGTGGQET